MARASAANQMGADFGVLSGLGGGAGITSY
jgi:hypothetical protein